MHYKYVKLNNEPIEIEYLPNERDERLDYAPSFFALKRRYFLRDFVRVHNNPWLGENYPAEVQAVECGNYYDPLFIALTDDGSGVYIFEEVATR